MCGCCRLAIVLISRRNRSAPITAASSGLSTLIATLRSCFRSWARYTVAIPPSPISRSTRQRSPTVVLRRSVCLTASRPTPSRHRIGERADRGPISTPAQRPPVQARNLPARSSANRIEPPLAVAERHERLQVRAREANHAIRRYRGQLGAFEPARVAAQWPILLVAAHPQRLAVGEQSQPHDVHQLF